ncbi:MAG: YggT family protein [Candidatus Komeilibacteria bacterium]|nr:YggT family protein [Candidatus Komeilibacteria bacterium]
MDSYNSPATKPLYRGTQIAWYLLGILEALLVFRFFLKMLGANPGAGFTNFIYDLTGPLVAPFFNVFGITQVTAGSIFEWTTLLAALVYWLIAWGIIKLLFISKPVSTPEAAAKLDEQDK